MTVRDTDVRRAEWDEVLTADACACVYLVSSIFWVEKTSAEAWRILTRSSFISDTAWSNIFLGSSRDLAALHHAMC